MCDYSLHHVKTRDAEVGDKLITKGFGTGTVGFCSVHEYNYAPENTTAVCLRPGTEVEVAGKAAKFAHKEGVAIYPQTENIYSAHLAGSPVAHRDLLEYPDGQQALLTSFPAGVLATVLQLPAEPLPEKAEPQAEPAITVTFANRPMEHIGD